MKFSSLSIVTAVAVLASQSGHAAGTINVVDNGTHVVATASGSFNTTALTSTTTNTSAVVNPDFFFGSVINVGGSVSPASQSSQVFLGIAGPTSFSSNTALDRTFADQATGSVIGLIAGRQLHLPFGYVSGTSLSGTATWLNESLSTLGLAAGTYTWNWGAGANADSLTLNISVAAVPEPATWAMGSAGLGVMALAIRRRKAAAAAKA